MFSHLLVSLILVIGGLIFGYRYLTSKYQKSHPQTKASIVKSVIGLPMLQFGIWALAFIPLWAFMPTHPKYDGGTAFWNSDLANWAIFRDLGNHAEKLYYNMYILGVEFLIFGGIAASIIYAITYNRIFSNSTIKKLCTTDTVFSALAAWNMLGLPLIPIVDFLFGWIDSIDTRVAFIIIAEVILAIWIIRRAIRLQKSFNRDILLLNSVEMAASSSISESTKQCPYCGETILAVAKKCKHCGEWIKAEDVVIPIKKLSCPICGELIEETATVCPYCNEKVEKAASAPRNAFREKVMAEKTSEKKNDGIGKTWIWVLGGVVAVAIICCILFSSKSGSSSNDNSYAGDSMVVVEEMPVETFEEVNDYDVSSVAPTDGMPDEDYQYLDHSAQGSYTEDEVSPSDFY